MVLEIVTLTAVTRLHGVKMQEATVADLKSLYQLFRMDTLWRYS
jgi:hypothetical protein